MNVGNKIHFSENFSEVFKYFKHKPLNNIGFVSGLFLEQELQYDRSENEWEKDRERKKERPAEPPFSCISKTLSMVQHHHRHQKHTETRWKHCTDLQSTTDDIKQFNHTDQTDHYHYHPQQTPQRNKMTTQITETELLWSIKLVETSLT